jgi:transglutaminase-like putative cysteine protease
VVDSVNTVRLEPRQFPFQRAVSALVRVLPATRVRRFRDLFENLTHHFEVADPHDSLEIESRVVVENLPLTLSDRDRSVGRDGYRDAHVRERIWPFLQDSPFVVRSPEMWRAALDVADGAGSIHDAARAIMGWIHGEFEYCSGSTSVQTRPGEVLEGRRGVCQDFTHVMIGMCRSIELPARYASGYLYNGPADHLLGAQASHAWCEVYLPESGWVGFDPTNGNLADARYVKVAVGRDYHDVAPVKGSYRGTGECRMEVEVEVERG